MSLCQSGLYSLYMMDPEHGWSERGPYSLQEAVQLAKDFRNDWAGSLVAVVPVSRDPSKVIKLVSRKSL